MKYSDIIGQQHIKEHFINAVKNNQVYYIDSNSASRPTQNIIKALKEIAKATYPDKYDK